MESLPQVLSQDTYASYGVPLSGLGGGGSAVSSFETLYSISSITSTLLVQGDARVLNLTAYGLSTTFLEADEAFISSISTIGIILDGAVLTTAGGTELLLNGIPVATTANVSSIADWAYDPAISTVNMNGNDLIAARYIGAQGIQALIYGGALTSTSRVVTVGVSADVVSTNLISTNAVFAGFVSTNLISTGAAFAGFVSTPAVYTSSIVAFDDLVGNLRIDSRTGIRLQSAGLSGNIGIYNKLDGVPDGNQIRFNTNDLFIDSDTLNVNTTGDIVMNNYSVANKITFSTNELLIGSDTLNVATTGNIIMSNYSEDVENGAEIISNIIVLNAPSVVAGDPGAGTSKLEASIISSFEIFVQNGVTVGAGGNVNLSGLGALVTEFIDAPAGGDITLTGVGAINGAVLAPPGGLGGSPGILQITGLSTINGAPFNSENITTSSLTVSSINGTAFPQPVADVSRWATYQAVSNVNLAGNSLIDSAGALTVQATNGNLNLIDDKGATVISDSVVNLTAKNGSGGTVNILADSGFGFINGGVVNVTANGGNAVAGLYGRVSIKAEPGTALGVDTGGVVEIIANSGTSASNLTSKISLNAGGINIYSGIGSPFASLFGYTYINASLGVSLVAGAFTSGLQSPGTVYLYGANGIVLGTTTYASLVTGFWDGLNTPSNLILTGRQTISGNSRVLVSNVDNISFESSQGRITGLSSINGAAYPPPAVEPTPDIQVSSILVNTAGYVSASRLYVSTINDLAYPPVLEPTPDIQVSTVTVNTEGYVSASRLYVSSINDLAYPPVLEPTPDIQVSSILVNTTGYISASQLFISSINNEAYPPPLPDVDPNPSFSTVTLAVDGSLTFADKVFGRIINLSTINGEPYIAAGSPDLSVSTIIVNPLGHISTTKIGGVSSIAGQTNEISFAGGANNGLILSGAGGSQIVLDAGGLPGNADIFIAGNNGAVIGLNPDGGVALNNTFVVGATGQTLTFSSLTEVVANTGQIYGLSSINGVAYPPLLEPTPNIQVSSVLVNATGYLSAPQLFVSSINNLAYPPVLEPTPNIQVSTVLVNTTGYVSASRLYVSTINDLAYPPVLEPTPNIQVSTVTVNPTGYLSAPQLFVSSINNLAYPPVLEPTPNIQVSSVLVNATGYVSASQIFVSSIQTVAGNFSTINMNPAGIINAHNITHPAGDFGDLIITQANTSGGLYLQIQEPALGLLGIDQTGTVYMNYKDFGGVTVNTAGDTLEFLPGLDAAVQGQIVGLSTINGVTYPPLLEPTPNIQVSSVLVNETGYVSASQLFVSSINGSVFPSPANPTPEVSSLTVNPTGGIFAKSIFNLNPGDVTVTQGNITDGVYLNIGSPAVAQIGVAVDGVVYMNYNLSGNVGGVTVNNSGNVLEFVPKADTSFQGQILGVSTVNGVAYPPVVEPTPNIQVSSVLVNATGYLSAPQLFVSSINNLAYPPVLEPTPNIQVSTLTANTEGYLSASRLYISSINDLAYPPVLEPTPNIQVSTVTVNPTGYVSAPQLFVSSINGSAFPSPGNPNPEVSTLLVNTTGYVSASQLFVSSINNSAYVPFTPVANNFSSITVNPTGFVSTPEVLGVTTLAFGPLIPVGKIDNLTLINTSPNSDFNIKTPGNRQMYIETTSSLLQLNSVGDIFMNSKNNSFVRVDTDANLYVSKGFLQVSSITGLSSINGQPYIPGGAAGVESVNGSAGAISIVSGTGISVTTVASTITITNTSPPSPDGVAKLNGLYGELNITSATGGLAVSAAGTSIDLSLLPNQTLSSLNINPSGSVSTVEVQGVSSIIANGPFDIKAGTDPVNFQYLDIQNFCSTGRVTVGINNSQLTLQPQGAFLVSEDSATSEVVMRNTSTIIQIGTASSLLPDKGLFLDETRLLFNSQDLITQTPTYSTVTASTVTVNKVIGISGKGASLEFNSLGANAVVLSSGDGTLLTFDNAGTASLTNATGATIGFTNTNATVATPGVGALFINPTTGASLVNADPITFAATASLNLAPTGAVTLASDEADVTVKSKAVTLTVTSTEAPDFPPDGLTVYSTKLGFNGRYIPQTASGYIPYAQQSSRFVSTPILGLTSTGLVMAQYNNSYSTISTFNTQGVYVIRVEPGTDSCYFQLTSDISVFDTVIWNVLDFGTGPYPPPEMPALESV